MPENHKKPSGIAFFDFDGTILTVESGPIYWINLLKDRIVPIFPSLKAAAAGFGYKMRFVRRRSVARIGVAAYKGLSYDQIKAWMKKAYPELIRPQLSRVILERIAWHQAQGHQTAIVSASPPFFVEEAAQDLKMDIVFGSQLEFKNGICTGKYFGNYLGGSNKLEVAKNQAEALDLSLQDCWFYTDHIADLALLEEVGHPVCVGPDKVLRGLAVKRGWEIVEHDLLGRKK